MSLLKKTRSDVKAAVASYLERRNYPDVDIFSGSSALSRSAEEMAIASIIQCETSRANSILFSCINNDPVQYDTQYTRLVNFIKEIKLESVKSELLTVLSPLLCHLYLELLRGGHGSAAQVLFKRHAGSLPQKDLSYHQPIDGNLPSALYRPNSLEQLFNSLQNGTIDNETPEKDYMNQILDDIGSIYTLQEVESRPSIAAFRSCKFDISLSQDALNLLKAYLAKHGHVLLMQVLQTWFHIDISNDPQKKNSEDDEDQIDEEINVTTNMEDKVSDTNDIFSKCNGHASDYQPHSVDKEIRDLQDAIKGVRDSITPLKLYKIAAPDTHVVCGVTGVNCGVVCAGTSDGAVLTWDVGMTHVARKRPAASQTCWPHPEYALSPSNGNTLLGHSGAVTSVHVLPRERLLLSASQDCSMRAWRLEDYSCAAIYRGHNYPIRCADVCPSGLFVATGGMDRTAKLWALDRTFPLRVFVGHVGDVTCIKFHWNEAYLFTGSSDRTVRVWAVSDARLVRLLCAHRATPRALAVAPHGRLLASAGDDKKIRVWDIAAGTCVHEYRGHHGKITALDWSAIGKPSLSGRSVSALRPPGGEDALLCSGGMDAAVTLVHTGGTHHKQSSSQDSQTTTFNTKCSYIVDVQVQPDWVVAIGTKR